MNPTKPISPSRMKLKFGRFYVVFFSAKGITGIIPRSYRSDRAARIRMTEEAILLCGCDEHPNLAIAMTQFNVVSTPKLKIIETSK